MDGSEKKASEMQSGEAAAEKPLMDSVTEAMTVAQDDEADEALDHATARITGLEAELAETRDKMLRALAETENTRRRAAKDRDEANRYGGMRLARDILSVHDNFKRALASIDDETREQAKEFVEGVELTQRELLNAFTKHDIVPITPQVGEKFDADRHQAMFEAPVPNVPDGSVIEVMQDGFMLSDRLLRAAMVGVARGGTKIAAANDGASDDDTEGGAS